MTLNRIWIARCLCVCFALACLSGAGAAQTRMGLVGPGVGWALVSQGAAYGPNDHLFWTSDDGGVWKDITPQDPVSHQIAGVFFLDASRGWVLLALKREPPKNNQEPDDFITDIRGFDLASTTDGGATWTVKHLDALSEGVGWLAASEIFFLDAAHGWMNIESPVPHWGGEGILLATIDGGSSWKPIVEVNGGGGYGPIRFTDSLYGWIAGGPGDQYLYSTNDGGRHWREVAVPAPPAISGLFENVAPQYVLPSFKDVKHGFLSVMYFGEAKSGEDISTQALFSTSDGGTTWHLESWVKLDQTANFPVVAVVDSTALAPKRLDRGPATLLKFGQGGRLTETRASELPEMSSGAALLGLNFNDLTHGWASSSDGRLLSTGDGGVTWKDISPGRKKMSMQAPSSPVHRPNLRSTTLQSSMVPSAVPGPIAAASTISTYKSRHLGFDLCTAPPDSPQMSTWWTSSPYFDIGIYVGGSTRTCSQPNLVSKWVTNVTGQGWGLMPLWPGPQAPCTCAPSNPPSTWPNCTKNWASTINTTGGAYAQGQAEADAATKGSRSAMQKLGLGVGSVIYYDIENYTPSATCNGNPTGSYINSFLSGWVSELHSNGYIAGVYGNPAPATAWYSGGSGYGAVSPSPDDVWITKYDNRVTIWGLTLTDTAWPLDQRTHQYFINQTNSSETWGGQPLVVDKDIEDADVTGGNGTKSYSFTCTTLPDFPGATNATTPWGINNSGEIVGYYGDSTGKDHGYLYDGTTFTSIDFPGAATTQAYGINNASSIVGFYTDLAGVTHGFLNQNGPFGSFTSFDPPGATTTYAWGINDATQISGYYIASGAYHGFLYQPNNPTPFTSIDYPGASGTQTYGINGDAQIAGYTNEGITFFYTYPGGSLSNPPVSSALRINNNEQIAGCQLSNCYFWHEGNSITILPPGATQMNPISPNDFILQNSQGTAKVAIVGSYNSSVNGYHGFIATSQ